MQAFNFAYRYTIYSTDLEVANIHWADLEVANIH